MKIQAGNFHVGLTFRWLFASGSAASLRSEVSFPAPVNTPGVATGDDLRRTDHRPVATISFPSAGASRLSLYSTDSTDWCRRHQRKTGIAGGESITVGPCTRATVLLGQTSAERQGISQPTGQTSALAPKVHAPAAGNFPDLFLPARILRANLEVPSRNGGVFMASHPPICFVILC